MKTDFRIVWEALTTCPGTCSGCNIAKKTDLENGFWSENNFKTAVRHTKQILKEKKYSTQKIFLNAGDYLYLSENQLTMIFDNINEALDKDAESRIVLFTTSAIGKPEFIIEKIDIIQKLLLERNLDCFPEIVFDFAKIKHKKYWKTYIDNIQILSQAFPVSAINIQVGTDTFNNNMDQEKLQEFIKYCGISRVEFVMSPHEGNAEVIKSVWHEAINFLTETSRNLDSKDKSFVHPQIGTIKNNLDANLLGSSTNQEYQAALESYQASSLYINFEGDISHFYSGISNIYPFMFAKGSIYKRNPVNIFKNMYLSIDKSQIIKQSVIFNNSISSKNKCSSCKFQKNCHSMGNMLLIQNMDMHNKDKCPLDIYEYLTYIESFHNPMQFACESLKTINTNYKNDLEKIEKFTIAKDVE